jgi:CHAT domain-containing protein/Tfp pilus assembly protein PilF
VSVEHDGDVELTLWGPDGQNMARGGPVDREGVEVLASITRMAGAHRLCLVGTRNAHYRLFIEARRPAVAEDSSRVAAQARLAQGFRYHQSAPDKAVGEFLKALPLWQKAGDVEGEVDTRNGLASTYLWLLQPPEALHWAQTALETARRAGYIRGQANALDNLGGALSLVQPEKAILAYREVIPLWKSLGDTIEQGNSLNNMGLVFSRQHDLEQARQAFEVALPLLQGNPDGMAYSLTGLGLIAQDQGDLDKALLYYERARDLRPGDPTILSNMAGVHLRRGNLQAALNLYVQSLALGGPGGLEKAEIVHNLASLYSALGEPEKALALYEQVLKLQQGNPRYAAFTLNSIGAVLFAMGDIRGAREKFEHALELSRDKRGRNVAAEAQALHNLGRLHEDEEPERALQELNEALALRNKDFTARARTLLEIGATQVKLGQLEQASASFTQALDLATRIRARALISRCRLGQAKLDRARGQLTAALEKIAKGLEVVETVRSDVASDDLRTSFFAANREFYELYVDLLLQRNEAPGDQARALVASEQARARGLRDLLAEGKIDVGGGVDRKLRQEELALTGQLDQTESQLTQVRQASRPDEAAARRLEEKLLKIEQQQHVLVGQIRAQNPRYAEVHYPESLDAQKIERMLAPQAALLEYAVGQERTALFVVTREGLAAYTLPFGARALNERVGRLRKALKSPSPALKRDYLREAAALYHDLVAPAEGSFRSKRELLISPDGVLHLLPFEALLTGPSTEPIPRLPFLLRRYAIAYVPSASVLAGLRASYRSADRKERAPSLVAFANPLTPKLAPLPESEREASSISGLFPPGHARLYVGREATKDKLIGKTLDGRSRVHFAVHGILNERWPQLSGLALTRGGNKDDDGFLRVHEIFNLKLNADLVVLSACDTAGAQVNGEGLVGLSRAFFYAGASSLVVSLWRVAESSTPELMVNFYRQLGKGKALALQTAKLELIEKERYAHPFYWAPFVLVGEPL